MLSAKTQYALHALTYLGERYGQDPIPISRIAEERKMPYKFLEAILLELRNNGILGSKAGKSGGYYLLTKPLKSNWWTSSGLSTAPLPNCLASARNSTNRAGYARIRRINATCASSSSRSGMLP